MQTSNSPTAEALQTMPLADLRQYAAAVETDFNFAKEERAKVAAALTARFKAATLQALAAKGKDSGKVALTLEDGKPAEAEVSKTVEWDSDKLMAVAQGMSFADVMTRFKVKFSMSEAAYKNLLPSDPQKATIDAARTVKYGDPKINLAPAAKAA
jgi:hypothetical protein